MDYLSGYVWKGTESGDSLLLQQAMTKGRAVLFCCVSDDGSGLEAGETVGGYLTGQLRRWFCDRGIRLCGKDAKDYIIERELRETLQNISKELRYFQEKKGGSSEAGVTGILVLGARFWMLQKGNSRVYLLNQRYRNSHIRLLIKAEETVLKQEPKIISGRLQKDLGILICTPSFCRGFSEEALAQCLNVREIKREIQIEKRLQELAKASPDEEGPTDGSAVFFKVI